MRHASMCEDRHSYHHLWIRYVVKEIKWLIYSPETNCLCAHLHDLSVTRWRHQMKTFPRYGPFVREFTGQRWIPRTKASDAELDVFFDPEPTVEQTMARRWFETPSCSLWRYCHDFGVYFPYCCATQKINTKITLSLLRKRIGVTWVYFRTTHNCELKSQLCV